ncbi:MAG: bifunctional metallophosphatase/5'-nucleotidase [Methanomicrobiales archaeon HGW-Methanomicrobiales-1]|jgi:5'-nucleotidase|nr:MAG: bifunctional metallophosphatase/5'-nucleotidase [Methanomicrobiales archaeon HGW-Methanomicrobiales-1]
MVSDSRKHRIPVELQIFFGFCILAILILAPILLSWYFPGTVPAMHTNATIHVKILAVNDFHGQLPPGQSMNKRPVGSAPVLASYLKSAMASGNADGIIIALPGDVVGASPPPSGLLADEPSLLFFNEFANPSCTGTIGTDPLCNMVATPGNHEFDRGTGELLRQVYGGNGTSPITHIIDPYPGSRSSYICANVVWNGNGTTIFPPYVIRNISGVPIAFIGADTVTTPERLAPHRADDVRFLNETESINRYVAEVRKDGIHAIVVLLHEGGVQQAYEGSTMDGTNVTGRVTGIVAGLDGDVDVVLSGHTHEFTNAWLPNAAGKPVLVTQAWSYSKGYADVDLVLDPASLDIVNKSARIVVAYADSPPGTAPDPEVAALLAKGGQAVAPVVGRQIAVIAQDITRDMNDSGESALGDLLADAQRSVMETDVAFITTGSIRSDLKQGNVTWGDLFTIQPFSGTVVSVKLTGQQIRDALERQWQEPLPPHPLGVSGLTYTYDATRPAGSRVQDVRIGGVPLDTAASYSAALMDYLSIGGDGYTVFTKGTLIASGPSDVDTLASYLGSFPRPMNATTDGRIRRIA